MAKSDVPLVSTGDWIDAAWLNQYLRDNIAAIWAGTDGGDLDYYASPTTKSRLAKPSVDSLLKNTSGGVPSWMPIADIPGVHAKTFVDYNASDQNIIGTTAVDVTGATVNIVTTRTCTIVLQASGVIATNVAGYRAYVRAAIGGVVQAAGFVHTSNPYYVPFAFTHYRAGVGAGTITCKLQGWANGASERAIFHSGKLVVFAFTE